MEVRDGVWHYVPGLPPQPALLIARFGATVESWEICAEVAESSGAPAEIRACARGEAPYGGGQ